MSRPRGPVVVSWPRLALHLMVAGLTYAAAYLLFDAIGLLEALRVEGARREYRLGGLLAICFAVIGARLFDRVVPLVPKR